MNAQSERPSALTQAEFARHRGVSKAVVTKWKGQGLLVMTAAGLVDVEATEWNLDQRPANYRGGTTHRPVRSVQRDEPDPRERPERKPEPTAKPASPEPRPADMDGEVDAYDPDAQDLPLNEAVRRKENYLGLFRRQEVLKNDKRLVDRGAAEKLFFDTARELRDAWMTWPARVAIEMADELNVDARTLTTILTAHVRKHIAELGEPEPDASIS
ncbi:hypothetical protein [Methylobacterium pseudosasicola]|uniref:Elements of external origin n=1 Tax=Methylobacterium pseudosasicola TaxID=582667 RepID=A0A1I4TH81_9HYPH|nr:hypothetical protein [Methylobacterium pseudosasicola]SFM76138.1 hypothetical protein SAMN05192568_10541 [Methylobacterium pseudosasicola]